MSSATASTRRGMARREAILAATCAVICRDGIDGVRSSAIATEAGVSAPIVHYYFPTLDDLVLAAYRWDEERFWGPADAPPPTGEAQQLLHGMVAGVFEHPEPESRDALRLWLEFARRGVFDPAVREPVELRLRRWGLAMEGLLGPDSRPAATRLAATMGGWGVLLLLDVVDLGQARAATAAAVTACAGWSTGAAPLPPAERREATAEADRRTAILDAALRVVGERGARHAEFRGIAAEAGVSDALPRYYHPTRHDLHEAMLLHASLRESERSAGAAAPFDDPRDRVRAMLARDLEGADAHRAWITRVELQHLGYADPALRPLAALPARNLITAVAAELDEARRRGLAAPDLDPAGAALRLVALRCGIAPGWLVGAVDRGEFADILLSAVDDELGV